MKIYEMKPEPGQNGALLNKYWQRSAWQKNRYFWNILGATWTF